MRDRRRAGVTHPLLWRAAARLARARDMPWAAALELRRLAAVPHIRLLFALNGVPWGVGWRIYGMPMIQRVRGSRIVLGSRLQLRSWRSANPLAPAHPVVLATRRRSARIEIGDDCGLTGTAIVASERVAIGDRVLIGSNTTIVDSDFHALTPAERRLGGDHAAAREVVIEDDVFVGMQCIVLKGVRIGCGSVVGAGSIVTRDVPPGVIAAGNPARVVSGLDAAQRSASVI